MKISAKLACPVLFVGLVLAVSRPIAAQGFDTKGPVADTHPNENDYNSTNYTPATPYEPTPRAIIHQNAQIRAQQRQMRIAAMNWYGMSNSRPTASITPFATLYSPTWQMPGGRPYAWNYNYNQPIYLILR